MKLLSWQKTLIFLLAMLLSYCVGTQFSAVPIIKKQTLDVIKNEQGYLSYVFKEKSIFVEPIKEEKSALLKYRKNGWIEKEKPSISTEIIAFSKGNEIVYQKLDISYSYKFWSLLPAFIALLFCIIFRNAIPALFGGIISGCLVLGKYNIGDVFVQEMGTVSTGKILFLYLILLGGLIGIWQKVGAARAFAEYMTEHFVKGPRSAKLVAWFLGFMFFQGGTISTVVVGTTVKPITDKENISHEELAYIVDSTASPIASQIPFNAWPAYIQGLIFVPGVAFLATPKLRLEFYIHSVPFCFYAILAILGTLLISIDKPFFVGKRLREAMKRSRTTGQLDLIIADDSKKIVEEVEKEKPKAHFSDFIICIITLIVIIIWQGDIIIGFSVTFAVAVALAFIRGLSLNKIVEGMVEGIQELLPGTIILILAITLGSLSIACGSGEYMSSLILKIGFPYWLLPIILLFITVVISFSTGTSWGTYALAFPIGMPLAWQIANEAGMPPDGVLFFMTICFACIMDGSVFGDQCSPISDTTVLTSTCTGCDLMEHVRTQIPQATFALSIAAVLWTATAYIFC